MKRTITSSILLIFAILSLSHCSVSREAKKVTPEVMGEEISPPLFKRVGQREFATTLFDWRKREGDRVFLGDKPAVIEFGAPWCYHCKVMIPILERLAKKYEGVVSFYGVNCQRNMELASALAVEALPTLHFVTKEMEVRIEVGARTEEQIEQIIETFLIEKSKKR